MIFSEAKHEEADEILKVVLDAYIIEVGDTGIAFKTKNRYVSVDMLHEDIKRSMDNAPGDDKPDSIYIVARESEGGPIVGCIRGVIAIEEDGEKVCEMGPIAVDPKIQGKGYGSKIMEEMERRAVKEREITFCQLTVVNWRTDVIPFYHKKGYVDVGTKPIR